MEYCFLQVYASEYNVELVASISFLEWKIFIISSEFAKKEKKIKFNKYL